jgi:hypothetical protein
LKKIFLVGFILLVLLVGVIATYTITVSNEADAITELSKAGAPAIVPKSCQILSIKKQVSDIKGVTDNPKKIVSQLSYFIGGKFYSETLRVETLETSEIKIKDLVASQCEARLLEITSEKVSEPKNVVIDYLLGELSNLKNAVYDLDKKQWVAR